MQALLLEAPKRFSVIERPMPQCGEHDAVLRIHRAGICATDITTIKGESPVAVYPMTPGHELLATVEQAAARSKFLKGDRVTIYPTQGCGHCKACARNEDNHCPSFRVWGVHRDGGCFAEFMAVPEHQLIAVPTALGDDAGALIEPTSVATHAIRRSALKPGQRVAIIGAGSIGLLIAQVARAAGASCVVISDRLPERKITCDRLGFDQFILSNDRLAAELTAGDPFDIVYDNVGIPATIAASVEALRTRGTLVMMAFPHGADPVTLPYPKFYRKELDVIVSRNYAREDFTAAIELLSARKIDAAQMITGVFPLAKFADAYADLQQNPARHLKILIAPQEKA